MTTVATLNRATRLTPDHWQLNNGIGQLRVKIGCGKPELGLTLRH